MAINNTNISLPISGTVLDTEVFTDGNNAYISLSDIFRVQSSYDHSFDLSIFNKIAEIMKKECGYMYVDTLKVQAMDYERCMIFEK